VKLLLLPGRQWTDRKVKPTAIGTVAVTTVLTAGMVFGPGSASAAPLLNTNATASTHYNAPQAKRDPAEPPPCAKERDGQDWKDGWDNIWKCGRNNGTWDWYWYSGGCAVHAVDVKARETVSAC
jgi:hypothetical protein